MTESLVTRSRILLVAIAAAALMLLAGCGGSDDTDGTAGGDSASKADVTAVCNAKDKLAKGVEGFETADASSAAGLSAEMSVLTRNLEQLRTEVAKLPADSRTAWDEAMVSFASAMSDVSDTLLDAVDAVRESGAEGAEKAYEKAQKQMADGFDTAYASVECP